MSEESFEIMRCAVNIARNGQVRGLATLRAILKEKFPGQDEQIEEAITAWANYEAGRDSNGNH